MNLLTEPITLPAWGFVVYLVLQAGWGFWLGWWVYHQRR